MSEKPDWKDAPEWANWLAQDGDGRWHWFEVEPEPRAFERWDAKGQMACPIHNRGPKEPRPKPKGQSISIPRGESLELRLAGSIPLQVYYGPLTVNIRIREDNV